MPFLLDLSEKPHPTSSLNISDPTIGFPKEHKFDRQLEKGSQGCVDQCMHIPSSTVIAVKTIQYIQHTPQEVVFLRELPPHKSIVSYLGYHENQPTPTTSSFILEYCPFGDLGDLYSRALDEGMSNFSEAFMWSVYSQLMSALAFLHKGIDAQNPQGCNDWRPIVHQDIKVENVLVKSLGSKPDWSDIDIKLGDFGVSTYYDPADPNPLRYIGTTSNWSPEISWKTKRLTPASDVWAAASTCLLYTSLSGLAR